MSRAALAAAVSDAAAIAAAAAAAAAVAFVKAEYVVYAVKGLLLGGPPRKPVVCL